MTNINQVVVGESYYLTSKSWGYPAMKIRVLRKWENSFNGEKATIVIDTNVKLFVKDADRRKIFVVTIGGLRSNWTMIPEKMHDRMKQEGVLDIWR